MKSVLLTFSLLASSALASNVTIKFSHVVSNDSPKGQMALKFKELVEKKSGGTMKVEIYPNSQLFNDREVFRGLLSRKVHIAAPSLSKFSRYTKKLQVYDLPFLFKDMAAVKKFQQGKTGQRLLKSLENKGIVGLGYLHNGLKQLSGDTPLLLPTDAKGKRFRIMASKVLEAQFDTIDAVPLVKPFSEVPTLLKNQLVNGQENTWSNIYWNDIYELQSDITETNHGLLDYMVITSKKFMYSLTREQQAIVKESIQESLALGNKLAARRNVSAKREIVDAATSTIHTLTDEQRAQWVTAMKPVWKQFEKDIGSDVIQAAIDSNE